MELGNDLIIRTSRALGPGALRAAARLADTAKAEAARLAGVTEPDMPSRQVMRRVMRKVVKRRLAEQKQAAIAGRRQKRSRTTIVEAAAVAGAQ